MPLDTHSEPAGAADPETAPRQARPRARQRAAAPEFPGCQPVKVPHKYIADYECRIEFWDAATETAWKVCDPVSLYHEHPSQSLAGWCELIAQMRGSPIRCIGPTDLVLRGEDGEWRRIMQADQGVYLHPARSRLPDDDGEGGRMVVGEHDFPDVVLEVDHTTDVRRGKLALYEEWGFPEVWVEVPERSTRGRRTRRRPGLTIHVLHDGKYRTADESRAFPGWTAAEIHAAMNERGPTAATGMILERVGRALGEREGTGPDDSPWLRRQRQHAHGEGRAELLGAVLPGLLAARGLPAAGLAPARQAVRAGVDEEAIVDAVLQCTDEADLRARLQRLQDSC